MGAPTPRPPLPRPPSTRPPVPQPARAQPRTPTDVRQAAGPLGHVITSDGSQVRGRAGRSLGLGANPLVLLHRVAFVVGEGVFDTKAETRLLAWADECNLGQDPHLIRSAVRRRDHALTLLTSNGRLVYERIRVAPLWRLAVGIGNRTNPYEIGMSLHGTYGWPQIPGSTIKGVTCAWARQCGADQAEPDRFEAIFGLPRPSTTRNGAAKTPSGPPTVGAGSVRFLDALPAGQPVTVGRDVVTPHVQPYYQGKAPPAEYHNPVPSPFLVITGGEFAIDLVGPYDDVHQAAAWLRTAIDELGVGAKTSAGYGYLTEPARPAAGDSR